MSTATHQTPEQKQAQIRNDRLAPFSALFAADGPEWVEVWVGGQWMLNGSYEPIPLLARVPNPLRQRQFMNQDDASGLPVHIISGHRSIADAKVTECPEETIKRLIVNEERRIRTDYSQSKKKEVDEMLRDMRAQITAAWEKHNASVRERLAAKSVADEDAIVKQAEEILARKKKTKKEV